MSKRILLGVTALFVLCVCFGASAEEKVKVKKILSAKLTDEDVTTLKALGKKYGRSLSILD